MHLILLMHSGFRSDDYCQQTIQGNANKEKPDKDNIVYHVISSMVLPSQHHQLTIAQVKGIIQRHSIVLAYQYESTDKHQSIYDASCHHYTPLRRPLPAEVTYTYPRHP